jgi:hypothetical protein
VGKGFRRRSRLELESLAQDFRDLYLPRSTGAIDIETIVECDLGIRIVPLHNLSRPSGSKAWLCCGGDTICVDVRLQRNHPDKYRMSITHEVAHARLHADLLPQRSFRGPDDFIRFHEGLTLGQINTMEAEARQWAGRVLVPRAELRTVFHHTLARIATYIGAETISDIGRFIVQDLIAQHFGVSLPSVRARIRHDGLWSDAEHQGWLPQRRDQRSRVG